MKPSMDHLLMTMVGTLGERIIPALPEECHALGDAKMVAAMAIILAQEVDRAADVLITENASLRALFGKAAAHDLGPLTAQLAEAAQSTDTDYKVSTLEAGNARLRTVLIVLQSKVEEHSEDWAKALNADIWAILKRGAEQRMLHLPSM